MKPRNPHLQMSNAQIILESVTVTAYEWSPAALGAPPFEIHRIGDDLIIRIEPDAAKRVIADFPAEVHAGLWALVKPNQEQRKDQKCK